MIVADRVSNWCIRSCYNNYKCSNNLQHERFWVLLLHVYMQGDGLMKTINNTFIIYLMSQNWNYNSSDVLVSRSSSVRSPSVRVSVPQMTVQSDFDYFLVYIYVFYSLMLNLKAFRTDTTNNKMLIKWFLFFQIKWIICIVFLIQTDAMNQAFKW